MSTENRPTLVIGEWVFDHLDYDSHNDVLYASIGEPKGGYGEENAEGHILRFDENNNFCGITLFGVASAGENMKVTVPVPPAQEKATLPGSDLRRALQPA